MSGGISATVAHELCAELGPWIEGDHEGSRWLVFPFLLLLRGPTPKRKPRDGGLGERLKMGGAGKIVGLCMPPASAASTVRPVRADVAAIRLGRRRFDADYVAAIERAYPMPEWRLAVGLNFGPGSRAKGWADALAFAFVGGRPVAILAPMRGRA